MNRPAVVGGVTLARALKELFTDDQAVTDQGVGVNLAQAMVMLAEAIDRNSEQIRRYNDRRDRDDGG
jgi:hypothetical protein